MAFWKKRKPQEQDVNNFAFDALADYLKDDTNNKKSTIQSTQAFSPVLDIQDGIIATKSGAYCKLLEVTPINFDLRSQQEKDDVIAMFNSALKTMPDTIHFKTSAVPSDVMPFIQALADRIEEEDSSNCRGLLRDQIQLIYNTARTQGLSRRFFISFGYEAQDSAGIVQRSPTKEQILLQLETQASEIAQNLSKCGNMVISNSSNDYILSTLYALNCKRKAADMPFEEHKKEILDRYEKAYGSDFDPSMIPVTDFISPDRIDTYMSPNYLVIDGVYTMYCYLPGDTYPTRALGGWLKVLFSYMDGVDVDIWIKRENPARIAPRLQFQLKSGGVRARNANTIDADYDEIMNTLESGYYIKQSMANGDDFCYFSTLITITAGSLADLNAKYREIRGNLARNDLQMKKCVFQQQQAYASAMPLVGYDPSIFNKSKRNIMGSQLGSIYPFTSYELMDEGGTFLGLNAHNGSPVFINNFDSSKYPNANMLIFGPSGTGKTYALMNMLLRMREKGHQVFVIAPLKGHEFRRACSAIGGEFISIKPGSGQNINIMEIRKTAYIDGQDQGAILPNKVQQVEQFCSILVSNMQEHEKQILDECIINTYKRFGITEDNASLEDPNRPGRYKPMPILGDLYEELKRAGEGAQRITSALQRYVTGSAKSFNAPTSIDIKNKYVVFDVSDLTEEMLPVGMFIVLEYVLDSAMADIVQRKVVAIDEMWRLMTASQASADFVVKAFKILRGYGGSVIGATQDLADVVTNKNGAAILNNAHIKFLFGTEKGEAEALASVIGLTEEEIANLRIASAQTSKENRGKCLLIINSNHLFMTVKASPIEHDLITTDPKDLERMRREGSDFVA